MPTKDKFYAVVKAALEKDGWQITHDPLLHCQLSTINCYNLPRSRPRQQQSADSKAKNYRQPSRHHWTQNSFDAH
ncbi:MAG: hypothetical protein HC789_18915 [Microcoleus sp. CSU_2_2]|nr:hypothetical protein [Microcoleus sp. SU_5_3]NJS12292.1 hypothetical protein [Microcoleus sp. CSU_2_2]